MLVSRRRLFGLFAAPAVVRASSLMAIVPVPLPLFVRYDWVPMASTVVCNAGDPIMELICKKYADWYFSQGAAGETPGGLADLIRGA